MTRDEALAVLKAAGVPDPATDTRRLWDYARKVGANSFVAIHEPNDLTRSVFASAIEKRRQRIPVSQIVGGRDFWKGWFHVTPDVLDPRPETETLVEVALFDPFAKVLDLGTGSGCVLISLLEERPEAHGVGTDVSDAAVLVAGRNAMLHGVADRLIFPLSDWYEDIGGRYDLIVSNPPYIAASEMAELEPEVRDHEPRLALTDEADGLTAYRKITACALDHLTPGGRLVVEIGWQQADAVQALFRDAGLTHVRCEKDLGGQDRVVIGYAPRS